MLLLLPCAALVLAATVAVDGAFEFDSKGGWRVMSPQWIQDQEGFDLCSIPRENEVRRLQRESSCFLGTAPAPGATSEPAARFPGRPPCPSARSAGRFRAQAVSSTGRACWPRCLERLLPAYTLLPLPLHTRSCRWTSSKKSTTRSRPSLSPAPSQGTRRPREAHAAARSLARLAPPRP